MSWTSCISTGPRGPAVKACWTPIGAPLAVVRTGGFSMWRRVVAAPIVVQDGLSPRSIGRDYGIASTAVLRGHRRMWHRQPRRRAVLRRAAVAQSAAQEARAGVGDAVVRPAGAWRGAHRCRTGPTAARTADSGRRPRDGDEPQARSGGRAGDAHCRGDPNHG